MKYGKTNIENPTKYEYWFHELFCFNYCRGQTLRSLTKLIIDSIETIFDATFDHVAVAIVW